MTHKTKPANTFRLAQRRAQDSRTQSYLNGHWIVSVFRDDILGQDGQHAMVVPKDDICERSISYERDPLGVNAAKVLQELLSSRRFLLLMSQNTDLESRLDVLGLLIILVVGCACRVGDNDNLILVNLSAPPPSILSRIPVCQVCRL